MDWTAAGAVGELLGAAAVVVTLLYLSVQIRQNTRAAIAQATASVAAEQERSLLTMAENDGLAEAYVKASRGEALSPLETTRLLFWWGSVVRTAESHLLQADLGTVSEDHAAAMAGVLRMFCGVPVLKRSLQDMLERELQTRAFRDWIQRHVL